MSSEAILFAYNKPVPVSRLLPGRDQLFEKLEDRDLRPVISVGAEAAFDGEMVDIFDDRRYSTENSPESLGRLALGSEVRTIVNRLDRSFRLGDLPPIVNENATRSLGHDKWVGYRDIFHDLGIATPTVMVQTPEDVDSFLELMDDVDDFIAKPRVGTFGKGVELLNRASLADSFKDHPERYAKYIIQPCIDTYTRLPASIKPYDAASAEHFAAANSPDKPKEIRMYSFFSRQGTAVFPVARTTVDHVDEWFFLDPATVPVELVSGSVAAMNATAAASNARGIYGTVDWVYGPSGKRDPHWSVMETNLRMPYLLGYDKHAGVADRLHGLFAEMLAGVARSTD